MKLCSHLCLLTDGTLGRFPTADIDAHGRIASLTLHEVLEEEAGMVFIGGIMVSNAHGLPRETTVSGADDLRNKLKGHEVSAGSDDIGVLTGINLLSLEGKGRLSPIVGMLSQGAPGITEQV